MRRLGLGLLDDLVHQLQCTFRGPRSGNEPESLNREAAEKLTSDPNGAESLLRKALTSDLFFGPAHNNLGVLHLKKGELYEAASEFEWARKLLPGNPDPRINLAITLERAGRTGDAMDAYKTALEVQPGCVADRKSKPPILEPR